VSLTRLLAAPDRTQQLRHARVHLCERLLALGVENACLQIFQEGDEAVRRRPEFVFNPKCRPIPRRKGPNPWMLGLAFMVFTRHVL
jgi:hypothetical protein